MDGIDLNIIDPNEIVFTELKKQHLSLANVNYESGKLIFPNGQVPLDGIELELFPSKIFDMSPENLYIYFSNKFYFHLPEQYNEEINYIFRLFTQLIITEEEEIRLKKFALDFWLRNKLLITENALAADLAFQQEYFARRNVLTRSYESGLMAASILTKTYNDIVEQEPKNDTNENNQSNEQNLSQGLALTRTRTKAGTPAVLEEESPRERFGIAGFMSTVLILALTMGFGIYIAIQIMK